jgi:hypothetical protein
LTSGSIEAASADDSQPSQVEFDTSCLAMSATYVGGDIDVKLMDRHRMYVLD